MQTQTLHNTKEWDVLFTASNVWRVGVYRPRFRSRSEISELEEHTCPEAFLLIAGSVTLFYRKDDGSLAEKKLIPMELTIVTEPHAGFSPNLDGVAFVIENAVFTTTYTDVHTSQVTRQVSVK
ncbi:MAG TPA: hypothetical protein PLY93_09175 [Turneriella sp.]|nr:hypothetical protein [Turneriella sp.]